MECRKCTQVKPNNEFPQDRMTRKCAHKNSFCFKCTIEHLTNHSTCPDCTLKVLNVDDKVKIYNANLNLRSRAKMNNPQQNGMTMMTVNVRKLDGETRAFPFHAEMAIHDLMKEIHRTWNYDPKQQTLLHNKNKLELRLSGRIATFADYAISNGSTVHLVITLLNIAADLDHAIFDLFWHYNKLAKKNLFIDASCIAFRNNQTQPACTVDIDQETAFGGCIKHSGDDLDRIECIGHHCLEVKFKHLPRDVTHLYFVLSAWNVPNMRDYFTSMALNFFDARDIFHPLCNTELQQQKLGKQAVIMCYAVCSDGLWQIIEAKIPCGGNVDNYDQIKAQVAQIHQTM